MIPITLISKKIDIQTSSRVEWPSTLSHRERNITKIPIFLTKTKSKVINSLTI